MPDLTPLIEAYKKKYSKPAEVERKELAQSKKPEVQKGKQFR